MRNWNGCAVWTPAVTVAPRKVSELQDVVRNGNQYPSPVRAIGSRHSLNECAVTVGTVWRVFVTCGCNLVRVDPESGMVSTVVRVVPAAV